MTVAEVPTVEEALERLAGRRALTIEVAAKARVVEETKGQNRKTRRNNLRLARLDVKARRTSAPRSTTSSSQQQAEDRAAVLRAQYVRQTTAVITKPGDPGGYRGEYNCSDCCSMTHCETHHKDEGTYPFDEAPVYGGPDESLDRGPSTVIDATTLLKELFPDTPLR